MRFEVKDTSNRCANDIGNCSGSFIGSVSGLGLCSVRLVAPPNNEYSPNYALVLQVLCIRKGSSVFRDWCGFLVSILQILIGIPETERPRCVS